uniref:G-protein coupled receptors family 1 profile domain-containing protein n=1 Tax=Dromaius novaehollandiae TaxID=8790 RepID=A0A8C4K6V7_DRONO
MACDRVHFQGINDHPGFQGILLIVFLVIYVITVVGNLGIVIVVWLDSHLQTPMYFFLSNLSFLDVCYSSAVTPKMLVNYSLERKTTSFAGCLIQLYFCVAFATLSSGRDGI